MTNIITRIIPYSQPDIIKPGVGPGIWNDQNYAAYPTSSNTNPNLTTSYFRISLSQLEDENGNPTWAKFDEHFIKAINARRKICMGIMLVVSGGADNYNGPVNYAGGSSLYPLHVHNTMQSEGNNKDILIDETWIPNWNSNGLHTKLEATYMRVANRIRTQRHNNILYRDALLAWEIRIMGNYGEWHHGGIVDEISQYPAYMRPTEATYMRVINGHKSAFHDMPLVILQSSLDAMRLRHTMIPASVGYYAMTTKNGWGEIGIRRDQIGSDEFQNPENYVHQYIDNNNVVVNGVVMKSLTMGKSDHAMIIGEPENNGKDLITLVEQVKLHRISVCGNGNNNSTDASDNAMREAGKYMGYRIVIEGGDYVVVGNKLNINIKWANPNKTPAYDNWIPVFKLKKADGTVAWTDKSQFDLKWFKNASTVGDSFTLPTSVVAGTYSLTIEVTDPTKYFPNMPLFIEGAASDRSYVLGSVVYAGGGTTPPDPIPNQKPIANAGTDQTIELPVSETTLSASAKDNDGIVTNIIWTTPLPSSVVIENPKSYTTKVKGLTEGIHTFIFTVRDNNNDVGSDSMTVTVKKGVVVPPDPIPVIVTAVSTVVTLSNGTTKVTPVVIK